MNLASCLVRNVRMSPQKVREVADVVRKMTVEKASDFLAQNKLKAATPLRKALISAIANAEHNHNMDVDDLKIARLIVDDARSMKRWRARAKGRGVRILKRSCHILIEVSEKR
jgi:large subunit ribosomal protein L22